MKNGASAKHIDNFISILVVLLFYHMSIWKILQEQKMNTAIITVYHYHKTINLTKEFDNLKFRVYTLLIETFI